VHQVPAGKELAPYSITVNDFLIENIDFSDAFKRSIEAKQIATQNALEEQAKVEAERNRAQQQVEKARGEAEAIRLRGAALHDNPDVLKLNFIEKLPNVQWGFLPGEGVVPFLHLPAPTAKP
jgi:regulator of protease activity HflC (stomatin/prohibitin superfamily)